MHITYKKSITDNESYFQMRELSEECSALADELKLVLANLILRDDLDV